MVRTSHVCTATALLLVHARHHDMSHYHRAELTMRGTGNSRRLQLVEFLPDTDPSPVLIVLEQKPWIPQLLFASLLTHATPAFLVPFCLRQRAMATSVAA